MPCQRHVQLIGVFAFSSLFLAACGRQVDRVDNRTESDAPSIAVPTPEDPNLDLWTLSPNGDTYKECAMTSVAVCLPFGCNIVRTGSDNPNIKYFLHYARRANGSWAAQKERRVLTPAQSTVEPERDLERFNNYVKLRIKNTGTVVEQYSLFLPYPNNPKVIWKYPYNNFNSQPLGAYVHHTLDCTAASRTSPR